MQQAEQISDEPVMLKVWEASKLARVGTAAIRSGIASGRIPHLKFGRNILIPRLAFLRWMDSCGRETQPIKSQHADGSNEAPLDHW